MKQSRYFSLGLLILMIGTTIFGMITMDILPTSVTKETEKDNEREILSKNLENTLSPSASAYYKTFNFGTRTTYNADTGLTFYYLMDMAEDSTYYYYTGYSINNSNTNRSVFLMRANKASLGTKVDYFNFQDGTNDTVGLCIDVDESRDRVYVGGYSGINYTASPTYETAAIAMVWCFNLNFTVMNWRLEITGSDGGVPWGRMSIEGQNDIGGQRIEDLVALPDGNVSICGTKFDYSWKGDFAYIATLNGDNGNIINSHHAIETWDNPLETPYYASVAKRIIYDDTNKRLIISVLSKKEWAGEDFEWFNYLVFCNIDGSKISNLWLDGDPHAVAHGISAYREIHYPQINSLYIAPDGSYWACGANRSSEYISDNQVVWKLSNMTGFVISEYNFPKYNRSAQFMSIDINGTLHLIGTVRANNTGIDGLIVQNFDMERNMFEINRTTYYQPSSYKSVLRSAIWNNAVREWIFAGYQTTTGVVQGFIQKVVTSTYLPSETLNPLSTYSHSLSIQLTWTQTHPELRYFRIYREEVAINLGNIGGFTPRATINISAPGSVASYTDTLPDEEGKLFYYALACTSDNITTLQAISTTSTTFYYAPDKPVPTVNPSWVKLNQNVNISDYQVANANIEIYESRTPFTAGDLPTMVPKYKGLSNNTITVNLNALGAWYYMINAYNNTVRGNTTSDLITIWCQDPAVSPPSLSVTLLNSDDGNLRLSWDKIENVHYLVYAKVNGTFTIATPRSSLVLVANTTTNQCSITNWPSGNWFFAVIGYNSSGEALSLSPIRNQTVKRTPLQPELRSPKGEASENGEISLEWDNVTLAKTYKLYRIFTQDVNDNIDEDNIAYATLVYSGQSLTFTEVVTENGYYIYLILAENENGHRLIDDSMCVKISVRITRQDPIGQGLIYGLIGLGVIIIAGVIIYIVYKRRNPYF